MLAFQVRFAVPAAVALSVKDTGICCGILVDPEAVMVMVALYVPATNPVRFTFAVTVPLLVPATGLRVSHAALLEAAQDKVPPAVLETVNVFETGLAPPVVPEKTRLLGLRAIFGAELMAVKIRVTGMDLVMPPPEIVTSPVSVSAARPANDPVVVKMPDCPAAMVCVVPGWTSVNQEIPSLHVIDNEVVPVVIVTEAVLLGDPTVVAMARLGGLTLKLDVELDGEHG